MSEPEVTKANGNPKLPWNGVWGVAYAVIIFFAASFIGGMLLWLGLMLLGWDNHRINDWLTNATAGQFAYVLIVEALTLIAIGFFLKMYKAKWSLLGFKRPRFLDVGIGLLAYPVYFIIFAIVLVIATHLFPGLDVDQEQQLGFNNVTGVVALSMTFISLVVLPPLVEEIVVRGLIFTSLRKYLKFFWAALLTSAIFAAAHLPEGGSSGPLYVAAIDTFMLSLVLCFLREKTGSLWAGITLHALKNGVAFVTLFILATH